MTLDGTVNTPVGTISKKAAVLGGGAIVTVGAVVLYRKKQANATPTGAGIDTTEIDPATGFAYGSPEDQAALAAQGTALGGPGSVSNVGGSGNIPSGGLQGYTSNAEWSQAVINLMSSEGLVSDPTQLSAALGKYLTGAFIDPNDTTDTSLIQQAIAIQGYPPIAGSNGFPPAINNHPGSTTPPVTTPSGGTTKPPSGGAVQIPYPGIPGLFLDAHQNHLKQVYNKTGKQSDLTAFFDSLDQHQQALWNAKNHGR